MPRRRKLPSAIADSGVTRVSIAITVALCGKWLRRFADELRKRQAVGLFHAGQRLQDLRQLRVAAPRGDDHRPQAVAVFPHAGRLGFAGGVKSCSWLQPSRANPVGRVAAVGDEADLLPHLHRSRRRSTPPP